MIKIDVVTTRGGDGGQTSLGDGSRVGKDDQRIAAIGAVDEANAAIGVVRLHTMGEEDAMLATMQNDLFDLGADLCVPPGDDGTRRLRIGEAHCARLEREIAALNADLPPLDSFVLPGGAPAAAYAHVARTIVRRAEREVARLGAEGANPNVLRSLNRLSDHLFVLSRSLNAGGQLDVKWMPGAGAN